MHQPVTPLWLRQVATALSTRYNVQVREGKGWSINLEKRIMYYKPEHLLALDRDTCLGILLHELGHLHFTTNDWTDTAKLYKDSNLQSICFNGVNAFEDVRINEQMSKSYGGSRDLIDAMNELLGSDGVKQFMTMSNDIKSGLRKRSDYNTPDWHEVFYISMAELLGQFPSDMPNSEYYDPAKLELCREIVAEFQAENLVDADSTQDIYDFVENVVFPRIAQWLPQSGGSPTPNGGNQQQKQTEKDATPESSESEGTGSSNQNPDTEDTSEASDDQGGNSPADSEAEPDESEDTQSQSGNSEGEAGKETSEASGKPQAPHEFSEDDWKRELEEKIQKAIKRGRVNPDDQHRTEPFQNGNGVGSGSQRIHANCNIERFAEESQTLQIKFRNKFESVFRDNSFARSVPNQKSGRLNKRVLYKHRLNNPRLFNKKSEISKKSYAVAFAMDLSSSMHPRQIEGSMKAMLAFTRTLDKLVIPYGVGFFSNRTAIGKHFAQRKVTDKYMSQQASTVTGGGTAPRQVLETLFGKELAQQRVEQRIGIVLTDGMWDTYDIEALHQLKKSNPAMHLYLVTLGMPDYYIEAMTEQIGKSATILCSDSADGIVEQYLKIAKKHLL